MTNTLLMFAHADEADAFADIPHEVSGVGKINAATNLALALVRAREAGEPVARVIVLGTCGLVSDDLGIEDVVQVTSCVQHDYSLPSPVLDLGPAVLDKTARIATGDQFVSDNTKRAEIRELGAALCDMEIYAYAYVCQQFGVDLQVFKIPSDFADDSASQELWDDVVKLKSAKLREFYDARLAG